MKSSPSLSFPYFSLMQLAIPFLASVCSLTSILNRSSTRLSWNLTQPTATWRWRFFPLCLVGELPSSPLLSVLSEPLLSFATTRSERPSVISPSPSPSLYSLALPSLHSAKFHSRNSTCRQHSNLLLHAARPTALLTGPISVKTKLSLGARDRGLLTCSILEAKDMFPFSVRDLLVLHLFLFGWITALLGTLSITRVTSCSMAKPTTTTPVSHLLMLL
mmetsp:Transcript_13025/g.23591  ORF Transcript_13025/g.23591 Transcript_13025/m.23591 type:complete len:218 (+) Transcript_13025:772-1425(+)